MVCGADEGACFLTCYIFVFLIVSLRRRTDEPSYSMVELDSQCPRLLRHAILKLLVRNPMELFGNTFRSPASLQKLRTS
jgi:hypothetical protein